MVEQWPDVQKKLIERKRRRLAEGLENPGGKTEGPDAGDTFFSVGSELKKELNGRFNGQGHAPNSGRARSPARRVITH